MNDDRVRWDLIRQWPGTLDAVPAKDENGIRINAEQVPELNRMSGFRCWVRKKQGSQFGSEMDEPENFENDKILLICIKSKFCPG